MALFEDSSMPGAPYLLAGLMSIWALIYTYELIFDEIRSQKSTSLKVDEELVSLLTDTN